MVMAVSDRDLAGYTARLDRTDILSDPTLVDALVLRALTAAFAELRARTVRAQPIPIEL
jgi:hypothetical protein